MIQANEIRIGNYVGHSILGGDNIVTEIYQKAVHLNGKIHTLLDYIEPIPLTPELLEKSGFEHYKNKNNSDMYKFEDYHCIWAGDGVFFRIFASKNTTFTPASEPFLVFNRRGTNHQPLIL